MILLAFYIIGFLVIWWCYLGYPIFLIRKPEMPLKASSNRTGTFSILVPTFNEKGQVKAKIENLRRLEYPKAKFRIIFVDGGSKDGTIEEIRRSKGVRLFVSRRGGKINDINSVLPKLKTDYVMITDADSLVSSNTLKEFNKILNGPEIGAVGAYTKPTKSTREEMDFWETNNRLRLLESRFFSSSTMIAASYAFRRKLIPKFEEDVIADDLFSTFKVLSKNYKVIYTDKATALERRSPSTFSEMVKHKSRKARANIKETIRFLPYTGKNRFWRIIYPTKVLQTIFIPLLLPIFVLLSLLYLFYNPFLVVFLVTISLITILMSPVNGGGKSRIFSKIKILFIINLILLYALLSYPFAKSTSRYKKTK
ncbi:MAG: glycosyltransferase [Candidatus Aenigmarchaeota archaeon]|nr:glycosyltransferase [Candidatus Aenigmarchaeota archaeon]